MIVVYTELPDDATGSARPLLDIVVGDMDELRFPCLVDSGALNTLVPNWLASAAGLNLRGAERRELGVVGARTTARFATTRISAGDYSWEAEIGFCDPWPYAWGLLGHRSFFRFFTVSFRTADLEFELAPIAS